MATSVRSFGKSGAMIGSVGVVGGAGGSYWLRAKLAGCDALVTGEVKHHEAVEAAESGFCVIEAGHFATEQPSVYALAERLESPGFVSRPSLLRKGNLGHRYRL
jgi:putative NIF3 family GTP cyclohydrolase 1 type 2